MLELEKRAVVYLPGVGPKKAEILERELGIVSYWDLLNYYPYKYMDRSRIYRVADLTDNLPYIQLCGRITRFETVGVGSGRRLVGKFTDGTGVIDLVWFKGLNFVTSKYKVDTEYLVFGKPVAFNHQYNIPHPDLDSVDQAKQLAGGLMPFYNTTEKMKKSFLTWNKESVDDRKIFKDLYELSDGVILLKEEEHKLAESREILGRNSGNSGNRKNNNFSRNKSR